jgi:putative restriction endonuclease
MKEGQKLWTREELILAINLYCKTTFGRLHSTNPDVIHLASLIGRTPNSVAFKLVNFASMDPSLQARGIKGAVNASRLDREIWNEFYNNWDERAYQSEQLLAEKENTTPEQLNNIPEMELPREGKTREAMIKVRVNQSFFRQMILADYNSTCCITGIRQPELLVAGHIMPWSLDEKNRLNPQNGIALNALHDRAFETGLLTITPELKIKISPSLFRQKKTQLLEDYFFRYDNQDIISPSKFLPDEEFLIYHNEVRFKK